MNTAAPKLARCAVYTRKSTEHNLDLAFTSLDAQREACEAYIRSQAGEGWRLLGDRYDDGGLSGASLDRPALQALLAEVRARNIDVVVVYKVDRLTRSLADFAKLIELFDAHAVSFVSVTQSFNTTTSMGRLTLNILLSFAQFEREVIGERVRDKIAASKRKGIWVGGPVPLGYAAVAKQIVVDPTAAESVRLIFTCYLELGSVKALAQDLERRGIRSKQRQFATGRTIGGGAFGVGALAYLLRNRFYIGEVVYRGETFRGDHEPILDPALFAAVQAKLSAQAVERRCRLRSSPALLTGRLLDEQGHRMTPTHTRKKGVRYRYYVSQAVLRGQSAALGRVSAPELEAVVVNAIRGHLRGDGPEPKLIPGADRELVKRHLLGVKVGAKEVTVHLRADIAGSVAAAGLGDPVADDADIAPTVIAIPWTASAATPMKGIAHVPAHNTPMKPGSREILLTAIAKARKWIKDVERGLSLADIARREAKAEHHIRNLVPLAFMSPRIVTAIIDGTAPPGLTATAIARRLPYSWAEQEQHVSIPQRLDCAVRPVMALAYGDALPATQHQPTRHEASAAVSNVRHRSKVARDHADDGRDHNHG
jgi:site-specific DNA recombinase